MFFQRILGHTFNSEIVKSYRDAMHFFVLKSPRYTKTMCRIFVYIFYWFTYDKRTTTTTHKSVRFDHF